MKWINDITTEHQKLLEEMLTIIKRIYNSNRIFENKPNEICSHLSEKAWKDRFVKVARYSFSGSISPKFEHKLRRHKQREKFCVYKWEPLVIQSYCLKVSFSREQY